ncbi:hypothetical protein BGZ63DRAFT_473636 [Mariannaea sp. PMI_226]|nr:hypothetical protein BGZ63DRAFT_473636 [Mariannaea sp. PMI_226]
MAKFTVYSFVGSQWAGPMHLALAEKGFTDKDYDIKEIDLVAAENFEQEYLDINPNATIPSLTSPSLNKPLIESTDIVRYLDGLKEPRTLVPENAETKRRAQEILDLVHSSEVDTNMILLEARDPAELDEKKAGIWGLFLSNRQRKLDTEHAANPDHPFYGSKAQENGQVNQLYTTELGSAHESFFKNSHKRYEGFAAGTAKLEKLLVLPYAAGDAVTEADLHVVPWLAHAMMGAGTELSEIHNFEPLEKLIQKSAPEFKIGPRTREWWNNISETASFKKVFPNLH